jgi:hypothetical protein
MRRCDVCLSAFLSFDAKVGVTVSVNGVTTRPFPRDMQQRKPDTEAPTTFDYSARHAKTGFASSTMLGLIFEYSW